MVVPTWAAWHFGWGLYWAWAFASAYIISLGLTFLLRFRTGKWKSMRVIEKTKALEEFPEESSGNGVASPPSSSVRQNAEIR